MERTRISKILTVLFAVVLCYGPVGLAEPLGTAFTYQGRLIDNNQPGDGLYDLQFKLYDSAADGNKIGSDVNSAETQVNDGYFTVELDYGNVFDGNSRWLEIGVRPGIQNDPNVYAALSPRQKITPAPYALYALNGGGGGGGGGGSPWQVSGSNIYYNNGNVGIGTTNPTDKLDVSGHINSNESYKLDGTTVLANTGPNNIFVGKYAGASNTTGYFNTFSGCEAGFSNTTGFWNTFSGYRAGYVNTEGLCNTFSGFQAGYVNTTGNYNTFSGGNAGSHNRTGCSNTFSGNSAGQSNITGNNNTFTGAWAGYNITTGSGNVFLGNEAGFFETGSNKLYIANFQTDANVLIYGDFSTGRIGLGTKTPGAKLEVAGQVKITGGSPGNGKVLTSDAGGLAAWQTVADPRIASSVQYRVPFWSGSALVDSLITYNSGNGFVGIGTASPGAELEVNGKLLTAYLQVTAGAGSGKVLTSDGSGNAWWQAPAAGSETDPQVSSSTTNKVPKWDGSTLIDSTIYDGGTNVGINTTTPARNLHINDVMRLQPRASAPSSPAEGDIYMNSTTHKLMVYDGTAWQACW